jgi:hypothetical protein
MADVNAYLPWIVTAAVLLLALLLLFLVLGMFQKRVRGRRGSRLSVSEYYELDKERRLVLIRRDGMEHLLLIGGDRDLVVETGIVGPGDSIGEPPRRNRLAPALDNRPPEPELARPAAQPAAPETPLRSPALRTAPATPRPAVFGDRGLRSGSLATKAVEPRLSETADAREDWDSSEPGQSSR